MKTPSPALTLLALLAFLPSAHSYAGGSSGKGGGTGTNSDLFDFAEDEGTTPVEITSLLAFTDVVEPLLRRIEAEVPEFGTKLRSAVADLHWFMEPKPLEAVDLANSAVVIADEKQVAVQDEHGKVRIQQGWFESKSPLIQGGLIVHELVTRLHLTRPTFAGHEVVCYGSTSEGIREVVRRLFDSSLSADQLREVIYDYGFGYPLTGREQRDPQARSPQTTSLYDACHRQIN